MIGQFIQRLHQGVAPERSVCNGGGSGGGSGGGGNTYYANYDKLMGAQADIAQNLYNQYASYAPTYLANSADMVEEAMGGTLANRARGIAGADAGQAFSSNMAAVDRSTAKYGAELNTNRMGALNRNAALGGALVKSNAMNNASQWAEDQKWNRNAGAYGQIAGMSNGAMQGFGSAASGYGSMAQSQSSLNAANAAGMGKFGAAIGTSMFKADGGYIEKPGLKMASGGMARRAPVPMQQVNWRTYPTIDRQSGGGGIGQAAGQLAVGLAPFAIGAGLKEYGMPAAKGAWSWMKDSLAKQIESSNRQNEISATENYIDGGGLASGYSGTVEAAAPVVESMATDGEAMMRDSEFYVANGGYIQKRGLRFANGGYALPQVEASASPESGVRRSQGQGSSGMSIQQGIGLATKGKNLLNKGQKAYQDSVRADYAKNASAASAANEGSQQAAIDYGMASGVGTEAMQSGTVSALGEGGVNAGSEQAATLAAQDSAFADQGSSFFGGNWGGAAISGATNAAQAQYTPNDPDGFGNYTPDYRHAAGSGVLSYYIPYVGGMVADVLHPVAEPVSRAMVTTGDSITDSSAGAMVLDPVATTTSGKYSPEQIMMDGAKENAKIFSAASFLGGDPIGGYLGGKIADWFADGGRVNMKPGGPVRGPGTETSDDIPAWLSDGEYVLNKPAVDAIGRSNLDKANKLGLKVRAGKLPPDAAKKIAIQGLKKKGVKRAKAKQRTS